VKTPKNIFCFLFFSLIFSSFTTAQSSTILVDSYGDYSARPDSDAITVLTSQATSILNPTTYGPQLVPWFNNSFYTGPSAQDPSLEYITLTSIGSTLSIGGVSYTLLNVTRAVNPKAHSIRYVNAIQFTTSLLTSTPTNTATNTCTNTPTPTCTNTPTNTKTSTPSPTWTNTVTPAPSWTPANGNQFTPTFTNTCTSTATSTATNTCTASPTVTPTYTTTNTATNTCTGTPTPLGWLTFTPTPGSGAGFLTYRQNGNANIYSSAVSYLSNLLGLPPGFSILGTGTNGAATNVSNNYEYSANPETTTPTPGASGTSNNLSGSNVFNGGICDAVNATFTPISANTIQGLTGSASFTNYGQEASVAPTFTPIAQTVLNCNGAAATVSTLGQIMGFGPTPTPLVLSAMVTLSNSETPVVAISNSCIGTTSRAVVTERAANGSVTVQTFGVTCVSGAVSVVGSATGPSTVYVAVFP
jgi:hypothetical protein